MTLDINEIQKILPHRPPFLLVDRILEIEPSKRIVGIKNVTMNEPLCLNFLSSMVFWDSKRPVTKNLLQRINLRAILARVNKDTLLSSMNTELERLGASPIQEKGGSNPSWEEILFQHAPKEEGFVEFLFK